MLNLNISGFERYAHLSLYFSDSLDQKLVLLPAGVIEINKDCVYSIIDNDLDKLTLFPDVRHPGNHLTTPLTLSHVYPTPLPIAETIVSKKLRITSIQEGILGSRSWYSVVEAVVERRGAALGLGLV